ncbi:hypothetical protein HK101_008482 [Irineochytrium annulatum]|nr:hypothetical protein HK101_008482 [Irineochytrium annulatum]
MPVKVPAKGATSSSYFTSKKKKAAAQQQQPPTSGNKGAYFSTKVNGMGAGGQYRAVNGGGQVFENYGSVFNVAIVIVCSMVVAFTVVAVVDKRGHLASRLATIQRLTRVDLSFLLPILNLPPDSQLPPSPTKDAAPHGRSSLGGARREADPVRIVPDISELVKGMAGEDVQCDEEVELQDDDETRVDSSAISPIHSTTTTTVQPRGGILSFPVRRAILAKTRSDPDFPLLAATPAIAASVIDGVDEIWESGVCAVAWVVGVTVVNPVMGVRGILRTFVGV